MIHNLIALGSDPELFLLDEEGINVPSEHYFKGDKDSPVDKGNGFFLLCDNVMVEFNTPPSYTKEEWVENHNTALALINAELPEYINIDISASTHFKKEYLKSKLARTFGCSPDLDIWREDYNQSPNARTTQRTAAKIVWQGL